MFVKPLVKYVIKNFVVQMNRFFMLLSIVHKSINLCEDAVSLEGVVFILTLRSSYLNYAEKNEHSGSFYDYSYKQNEVVL